ncbi:MAG TPA: NADPH-dependent FMN reductase [Thermoleophilia bacterium]|nr:NADPH-dependent FMN reductase [Thermoleophilia bacterium]
MADPLRLLGFAGSLRRGSYNRAALHVAAELAPVGMEVEIFDLTPIPFYNADVEAEEPPPNVVDFKERIARSDALLIATPEYNYSIPGVLKNAIDWASRPADLSPLKGKPVALLGAGGRMGTARSQMHMRQVAVFTGMQVMVDPQVYIADARGQFDEHGHLTNELYREQIRALMAALWDWTLLIQGRSS